MRVRLINPFTVRIARLDTVKTESETSGKPGYDQTFREPAVKIIDGKRTEGRAEKNLVSIQAQIEDRTWEALKMYDNGDSPEIDLAIVAHYHDLKCKGLVDCTNGKVDFNVNDRLDSILDKCGNVVSKPRTPPGLYVIEVRPMSYGIGRRLNLLMMLFKSRSHGAKA